MENNNNFLELQSNSKLTYVEINLANMSVDHHLKNKK
jgi:hypothetical protein